MVNCVNEYSDEVYSLLPKILARLLNTPGITRAGFSTGRIEIRYGGNGTLYHFNDYLARVQESTAQGTAKFSIKQIPTDNNKSKNSQSKFALSFPENGDRENTNIETTLFGILQSIEQYQPTV